MIELSTTRHNPFVDPQLHVWGWEIPVYLFFGGLVAGMMVLGGLALRRMARGDDPRSFFSLQAPLLGFVLINLGMGALLLDLTHKLYVWRVFMTFQPASPMSWGAWVLMLVYPVLIGSWLGGLDEQARAWAKKLPLSSMIQTIFEYADSRRGAIQSASIGLGLGLGVYTGLLLGTMAARLPWNTAALGPLFLVSGVSTGAALLLLLNREPERAPLLVRWDTAAILVELGILAVMLLGFRSAGARGRLVVDALLGGPWTPWFWSLVVVAGLLVPLSLNLLEQRRHLPMNRLAPLLVLVGGFGLRFVLVAVGQDLSYSLLP